jgi:hypothetical protein
VTCQCADGTWGTENKNPICRNPVYIEGELCLNCAHDRACHEKKEKPNDKQV